MEIRDKLGYDDELYIEHSSIVASIAISIIIKWYNHQASIKVYGTSADDNSTILRILKRIKHIDMDEKTKSHLDNNFSIIKRNKQAQGGGGCYIATMVFGDYDAAEVIVLREFRDNVLTKSSIGRKFITLYYKYSPKLVEKYKDNRKVNDVIRKILNRFIGVLK